MDRKFIVKTPTQQMLQDPLTVHERMLDADFVEFRVSLTPMKWYQHTHIDIEQGTKTGNTRELRPIGDTCYSAYSVDRYLLVDSKDHAALWHIGRQILENLFRTYFGMGQ